MANLSDGSLTLEPGASLECPVEGGHPLEACQRMQPIESLGHVRHFQFVQEWSQGFTLPPRLREQPEPFDLPQLRAGYFVGSAGNQTARVGQFLRELNRPCDFLATSDNWGVTKPSPDFFAKLIEVSGHLAEEIAYVGDRLDNDVEPAAAAGLFTIRVKRGPSGLDDR